MADENIIHEEVTALSELPGSAQAEATSLGSASHVEVKSSALPAGQPAPKSRRSGRVALALLMLLLGIVLGIVGSLLFAVLTSGKAAPLPQVSATPTPGNVTIHADAALLAPLMEMSLQDAGLPGKITNVQLKFAEGQDMTITGNYIMSVLNKPLALPLNVELQPYPQQCRIAVHVLQANVSNIPMTSFVSSFENELNKQLLPLQNNLPVNVEYCVVGIHTDTTGLGATFELVLPSTPVR